MSERWLIRSVSTAGELEQALALRHEVFVEEQKVPAELERDGIDADAYHVLAVRTSMPDEGVAAAAAAAASRPLGTGRAFRLPGRPGHAGIGRIAVRAEARRQGIASALVRHLVAWCLAQGLTTVELHAQAHLVEFYRRLGFQPVGEPFVEAGIMHVTMVGGWRPDAARDGDE